MKLATVSLLTLFISTVAASPFPNADDQIEGQAKVLEARLVYSTDGDGPSADLDKRTKKVNPKFVKATTTRKVTTTKKITTTKKKTTTKKITTTKKVTSTKKTTTTKATTTTIPTSLPSQMVYYHNAWRAHHGVGAVTWNSTLASAALVSASKCVFAHTKNNPYGENIAAGTYTNPAFYAALWYNEVSQYDFNNPGFSGATGHFTQVVWKNSKQIGCAWVRNCPGNYPNMLFCEYSPYGNVLPESNFRENVLPAKSSPQNPPNPPSNL
ncbi:hypothetical protein H072_5632 [Dactylellina haptotyla CBS 200.50]|uniref:SCP domain-containing protein n=1 Tax=Dactylellina haptotyla (strain CBS 200.50) TaxID=1284197 RepID=S8BM22_DACHA|nr:hypothetical protein H072_5632 [Dactylellina haptotyla CBS 200.50]